MHIVALVADRRQKGKESSLHNSLHLSKLQASLILLAITYNDDQCIQ